MADAICRWRNPYIDTIKELIEILPKVELTKQQARNSVVSKSPSFYRTPYQLACQVGLYHETDGFYYPKFNSMASDDNLLKYLENWIVHYTVPNPYTRSLPSNIKPFSIHAEVCRKLIEAQSDLSWNSTLYNLFGIEIGNKDILKNSFNYYSPVFNIEGDSIKLKTGIAYDDLQQYVKVDISTNRDNKEYFFDLFEVSQEINFVDNILVTEATTEELNLINQIQSSNQYTQTEKNQIVKARIGQGLFRRNLISDCPFCPITKIDDSKLLIASHIKPWRTSNNIERLDFKNGLLLTPTFDKLFDLGFITFRNDKSLQISSQISDVNINRLGIKNNMEIVNLPINGREAYFEYHRTEIFKS